MSQEIKPYFRGPQLLRLFYEQGPLSVWGLKRIISPAMTSRRISDCVRRLKRKGYLVRRFDSLPDNIGHFHQISQDSSIRDEIARILKLPPDKFREPIIRDQELIHSQLCAVWSVRLKQLFPTAQVLREHQIYSSPIALRRLIREAHEYDLQPDILLLIPKNEADDCVTVAIEIERSRKTHRRILEKLNKYSRETLVDGVIYACALESILSMVHMIYEKDVRKNALAINNYGDNYLLFAHNFLPQNFNNLLLTNCARQHVRLHEWIQQLLATNREERYDHKFKISAPLG